MKLIVSNNLRIENPNKAIIDYCKKKLTIDNPDFINAEKMGRYTGNIPRELKLYYVNGNTYVLPFGVIKDIWKLGTFDYTLDFSDFKPLKMSGRINLRDYQEKALKSLLKGKNGILEAPCGSGKTQIGLALIKAIGGKALWLTHTKELLKQSMLRCKLYYEGDFGTITEGEVHIGEDITFATVQTMCKLEPSVYANEFNTIIVDECHHCVGTPTKVMSFYKVLTNCKARYKYGLSATLTRSDSMITCVFSILGDILHTITREEVGTNIIKADYKPVHIMKDYDQRLFLDTDGTIIYNKLIDTLCEDDDRNDIIINNVISNKGRQLILSHRVAHCERLAKILKDKGLSVDCITGMNKHRTFSADIIVATYSLAKEGLDIPDLQVLHLATPQKNKAVTEQAVGRIERNFEGKEQPICYDYVDDTISYCTRCFTLRKRIIKK